MALFPDEYIHLGGDEVEIQCWKEDRTLQARMHGLHIRRESSLLQLFFDRVFAIVSSKKAIVWQEIKSNHIKLPQDAVVQTWLSLSSTYTLGTRRGHRAISSWGSYYDVNKYGWGGWPSWKDYYARTHPYKSYHEANQRGKIKPTEHDFELILGGEGCAWEFRQDEFDEKVWRKATATAERLWSSPHVRSAPLARKRILFFHDLLVRRGAKMSLLTEHEVVFSPSDKPITPEP